MLLAYDENPGISFWIYQTCSERKYSAWKTKKSADLLKKHIPATAFGWMNIPGAEAENKPLSLSDFNDTEYGFQHSFTVSAENLNQTG